MYKNEKTYSFDLSHWSDELQRLEAEYQYKAHEIAMKQWTDLLNEIDTYLDDQHCDLLYSFTDKEGVVCTGKGGMTIDFSAPKTTFSSRILALRSQLILAMSSCEKDSKLYEILDSLYIIVLYAYYEDESSMILHQWQSQKEKQLQKSLSVNMVNDIVRHTLEKILI